MATRYWVGGTGTWDASSTTNWAASSGGASGASAPTSTDSVIIDASSGTGVVTFAVSGAVCLDLTVTTTQVFKLGAAVASPTQSLTVYGNLAFPASSNFTTSGFSTCTTTFAATTTGKTIDAQYGVAATTASFVAIFNGVGGAWTLLSDLSAGSNGMTFTNGTLNLSTFTLTAGTFTNSATGTVVINGNTGTFAGLQYSNSWFSTYTGLTLNVSTATVAFQRIQGTMNFNSGGFTYGNFTFLPAASVGSNYNFTAAVTVAGTVSMQSAATLSFTVTLLSGATFSCNNWTAGGASASVRMILTASSASQATLTRATSGTNTINYATVSYINGNNVATGGGAVVWNFTNSTNAGNNTGLTGLPLPSARLSTTGTLSTNAAFDEASLAAGAISFNGSTQYLSTTGTVSGPLDLATGAGDWTIECWFNPVSVASGAVFWKGGTTGSVNPSYGLFFASSGVLQWIVGDGGGGGAVVSLSAITANAWYHFALVRSGSTFTSYVNGVAGTPYTTVFTMGNTSNNAFNIANSAADGSSRPFNGSISNFRIVKGTAVYTANFTPPQATLAAITNTSLLLNVIDSANFIRDNSPNNLVLTNNATATWSTTGPFNRGVTALKQRLVSDGTVEVYSSFDELSLASGSAQFASTNLQCLSAAHPTAFDFGTGDFTAECFFYPTTTQTAYGTLITTSYPADTQGFFFGTFSNQLGMLLGNTASGWFYTMPLQGTFNTNVWNHAALCRSGTNYYVYLNGSRVNTNTTATAMTYTQNKISVGGRANTQGQIGYVGQVRVIKGTALYTGATYTVPNLGLLPSTADTVLLLNMLSSSTFTQDSSPLRNTVTNNVSVVWNANGVFNNGATALQQRQINDGTLQVTTAFDEVTGIT